MKTTDVGAVTGVIVGLVFVISAVPKLRHPWGFVVTVLAYDILPSWLARLFAFALPVLELFAGVFLLTGTLSRIAAIAACLLCLSFAFAISVNLRRGRTFECGCFGPGSRRIGPRALIEDLLLLATGVLSAVAQPGWLALSPWSPLDSASMSLGGAVVICSGISVAVAAALATVGRKGRQAPPGIGHRTSRA